MAETVHARRYYNPEDVLYNVRFVDMIDPKSKAGVIVIDHSLLNEVRPLSLAPTASVDTALPVASDANSESASAEAPLSARG